MNTTARKYDLSADGIEEFSSEFRKSGFSDRIDRSSALRTVLSFENILLDCLEHYGEGNVFSFSTKQTLHRIEFSLEIRGDAFNPLAARDGEMNELMGRIGLSPSYSFSGGANCFRIVHEAKRKLPFIARLGIAIATGVLLGIAGMLLPPGFSKYAGIILEPVSDLVFGLIRMVALPVVFLCTISGILSTGDVSTFGKVGKRILSCYFLMMLFQLILVTGGSLMTMEFDFSGSSSGAEVAESLVVMLFSIFPDNLFMPFADGNNIQVILIAVLFGVGLLIMGKRAERVTALLDQLRELSTMVMQWVSEMIPILVFVLIAMNMWNRSELVQAISAWKAIVIILLSYIIAIAVDIIIVARRKKLSVGYILAAIMPVCIKGMLSASSIFAFTDMEKTLKEKLRTDEGLTEFSLSLGIAFFHSDLVVITGITIYFASISGISISAMWLVRFMIMCYIMSIAIPSVSGGYIAVIAILFDTFGINPVYLGLASSIAVLLDYPNTGGRVGLMMLEIARADGSVENRHDK